MSIFSKSKKLNFNNLTSENECKKEKLTGNLKDHLKFITTDIFLNENSIVIDCGANIGDITSVFSRFGCKVYCFEPTEKTFNVLQKRFKKQLNVKCFKKAVHTKNENLKFYHHELSKQNEIYWSTGNSLLQEKSNVNKDDYEIVECIDFVEFINSLVLKENQIDLIKIDIEGAEVELINYIIDSGSIDNIKQIICEVHDKKYKFLSEKTNLLRQKIIDNNLSDKINLDWK